MFSISVFAHVVFFSCFAIINTSNYLTFKNVMVYCDSGNAVGEDSFATTVTAKRLKSHLPSTTDCEKITIERSNIPILYEGALADIQGVKVLFLESNNIREIRPGAFANLSLLDGMSLKHNALEEIRGGVFNHVRVPVLYLSHNAISTIHHDAFNNMPILRDLRLDNNKIFNLGDWFKNSPQLKRVDFSHNFIRRIPNFAFMNLQTSDYNAPEIDLSYNRIDNIEKGALVRNVKKNNKYDFLSLAHNRINDLDPDWLKDVEISNLDVSHNDLRCLAHGGSTSNYLDSNPWNCECLRKIKKNFGRVVADKEFKRCRI